MQASRTLIFAYMALTMASTPTYADSPTVKAVQIVEIKPFRAPSALTWKKLREGLPPQKCSPEDEKALLDPVERYIQQGFCTLQAATENATLPN